MKPDRFGEDYFERGVEKGLSCYENYHWMPEPTLRAAHYIIRHLRLSPGDQVMDFGCAKGYYVKALRLLDIIAYGMDISKYAIDNAPQEVRPYLIQMGAPDDFIGFIATDAKWIMSKDVLEHLESHDLEVFMSRSSQQFNRAFHIVPLAEKEGGKYLDAENERDTSHIHRHTVEGWLDYFGLFGWDLVNFAYRVEGLKERARISAPFGYGFYVLEQR